MTEAVKQEPHFNLWDEPWITLELPTGGMERLGIAATLLRAGDFTGIYDPSPLVIASIHRLLTAILQGICNPQRPPDLTRLRADRCFPTDKIKAFGTQYADRFDIFSQPMPFLQSADLPLQPTKADASRLKSVSQLTVETSRSTALDHYRHGRIFDEQFCPACAARGLVTIPSFTSSGGRGLKPSINGVPPIYVLPGGASLFESLAASVLLPDYLPAARSTNGDMPWWSRPPIVQTQEVYEVGYLQSLTFPARRVRLHPQLLTGHCTRCSEAVGWGARTMIFEMGESRSKETAFWQDPFVAYRQGEKGPIPIRPQEGKALWREFAGLFLVYPKNTKSDVTLRPRVLDQVADQEAETGNEITNRLFRCIGLRTDNKAKVFEWLDAGFDVPTAILQDEDASLHIRYALEFASECDRELASAFRKHFGGKSQKGERHRRLKEQMRADFWSTLAAPFREFVLALGQVSITERLPQSSAWADTVVATGRAAFKQAAEAVGDDAASLRQRVQGQERCNYALNIKRKKFWVAKE